ncbi:MAG TPA: PAS domain S-box protein [Anaeromyxobacteraceae bacterium]|nr:PAS domain S-box protein [Anaeromyxobacteraceae bacterium]
MEGGRGKQHGRVGTGPSDASTARFQALIDGLADGYVRVTMDGRIVETNQAYRKMLGYGADELRSMTYMDLTPTQWHAMEQRIVERQVLERLHSEVYEKEYRRKDGTVFPVEFRTYLVVEEGRPVGMWALVRDITERKRTEEALAASEELFRVAFEGSPVGVALMAPDGRPIRLNPALCDLLGYPVTRLITGHWADFTHPEDLEATARTIEGVRATPGSRGRMEKRFIRSDGSTVWTEVTTRAVRNTSDEVTHFITTVVDIDARKKAEEDLRASQELFRTLTDSAPVGIFRADESGHLVYVNPTCERMLGTAADKLLGRGWLESVHPGDRDRVDRAWREAVAAGRVYEGETRYLGPEGVVIGRSHGVAIRDAAGRPTGYVGVVEDVTRERALEKQAARAARLSSLGALMSGVAHEVNSPLASIRMSLEILRDALARLPAPPLAAKAIDHAEAEADRVARFVRDLNVVGRPDAARGRVDLAPVVDRAVEWLRRGLREGIDVRVERLDSPTVIASEGQIAQVAANLVTHAIGSIPAGRPGRVTVRVGGGGNGMARLEVVDDGTGTPPADLERMFEPFFGSHPSAPGNGLALSVCHDIVASLGGTIAAASETGGGTAIRVEFPLAT